MLFSFPLPRVVGVYFRDGGVQYVLLEQVASLHCVTLFTLRQRVPRHLIHDVPELKWHLIAAEVLPPTWRSASFLCEEAWGTLIAEAPAASTPPPFEASEAEEEDFTPTDGDLSAMQVDEDTSSCSSSEEDEEELARLQRLPKALAPTSEWLWVFSVTIPHGFERSQYAKRYQLQLETAPSTLKKELKRYRRWWRKKLNLQRQAPAIGESSVAKRVERALCFLGFVTKYHCMAKGCSLTLALLLNHKLMDAFLLYLTVVRRAKPGTVGKFLTMAVSVCKWLFRRDSDTGRHFERIAVIRRYQLLRNHYQSKAAKKRAGDDVEVLRSRNKWLEWTDFVALVKKLRAKWAKRNERPKVDATAARELHDLLPLGLYSLIPGRAAEVRTLEWWSPADVRLHKW